MPSVQDTNAHALVVEVLDDDGDWSDLANAEALIAQAAEAVANAPIEGAVGSVAVSLSSDEVVAQLNGQFRGKPKPTNVLSFPAGAGAPPGFIGDVILAHETVVREAQEQDLQLREHVQHLVVHGILHLLGYDHETADMAEKMEALEISILSSLGIANPYTGALETGKSE